MIGYHYTSFENYQKIQKQGLRPYQLPEYVHEQIKLFCPEHNSKMRAIWVWQEQPVGRNHVGNIIRVVAKQDTTKVILLQIEYDERFIYTPRPSIRLRLPHRGSIERFVYHEKALANLLVANIRPEHINPIQTVDLKQLLKLRS